MLQGKLVLFDISDTEAFCARIVNRSGLDLDYHQREDLLAYLVETAWELSERWDPSITGKNFSGYCLHTLRRRRTDWQRGKYRTKWQFADRTYERPTPEFCPIDDRPDIVDHSELMDIDVCSDKALVRLLRERGSEPFGRDGEVGAAAPRVAA